MSTPAAENGPEDLNHRSFWMVSEEEEEEEEPLELQEPVQGPPRRRHFSPLMAAVRLLPAPPPPSVFHLRLRPSLLLLSFLPSTRPLCLPLVWTGLNVNVLACALAVTASLVHSAFMS